ncbi:Lon protease-like protein [Catenuloplanes nepalensis]|uniref:Lon protease-like protein n=1 Tax=Catenuloplanes nepalensis TaxID=587533 RepID=A0ABT9ML46_9ACTN|nr:LON peptidase substrate-binding domain-containing protein [Catenuloplanes nepalensis]MDP9791988.1 Lon protease-like protein [Catenuloplanes nepalensis]
MVTRLPVFPLGTVLFPGLVMPLHIFEERYRELVRDLVARPEETPREFGVVAIRSGWEVLPAGPGGPDAAAARVTLHEIGCTAEVRQVTELPDGQFDLLTVGRRRFRITEVMPDPAPYLVAQVEWLPEPAGAEDVADLLAPRVLATFREYLSLMRPESPDVPEQLPDDPTTLSHLVAATGAFTVEDRQALLAATDTAARLRAELKLLTREAALFRTVRAVPVPLSEYATPSSQN